MSNFTSNMDQFYSILDESRVSAPNVLESQLLLQIDKLKAELNSEREKGVNLEEETEKLKHRIDELENSRPDVGAQEKSLRKAKKQNDRNKSEIARQKVVIQLLRKSVEDKNAIIARHRECFMCSINSRVEQNAQTDRDMERKLSKIVLDCPPKERLVHSEDESRYDESRYEEEC